LLSAVFEGVVSHDISRDANASLVSTVSSTIIQRVVRKCSNGALHASVYQRLTNSQITYALDKLVTAVSLFFFCSESDLTLTPLPLQESRAGCPPLPGYTQFLNVGKVGFGLPGS
jgi:hypothetical protein